jgi:hypothetical protein
MRRFEFTLFEVILTCSLLMALFFTPFLSAAASSSSVVPERGYTVKKGDWILNILRNELHVISPLELKNALEAVKKLNPQIKDFNKIKPGQSIALPEVLSFSKKPAKDAAACRKYLVKEGDSILVILRRELKIKDEDIDKTMQQVINLNPNIRNFSNIHNGTAICLPEDIYSNKTVPMKTKLSGQEAPTETKNIEKQYLDTLSINLLDILKHILSQINGAIIESGNYIIPFRPSGQAVIDCSKVPVVEFDDGTTVFLDSENNISEKLRMLISSSWKNFHVINANKNQDAIATLGKIINCTGSYVFSRPAKPIVIGNSPKITLNADWLITSRKDMTNLAFCFAQSKSQLLPEPIISRAKSQGITITEILDGAVFKASATFDIASAEDAIPEIPTLPGTTPVALASSVLSTFSFTPAQDAKVEAFVKGEKGCNPAINADLLLKKDQKQIVFVSEQPPTDFTDALKKESDMEIVLLDRNESAKSIIEKTLTAVALPFSFQEYFFPFPNENQAKALISFSAFKVQRNGTPVYLIDFDMDHDLYKLIFKQWKVSLIKY